MLSELAYHLFIACIRKNYKEIYPEFIFTHEQKSSMMKSLMTVIEFDKRNLDTYIILLSVPVLLVIYWYHGSAENFGNYFPGFLSHPLYNFYSYLWQFFSFFLLTFIIPSIIIKYQFKRSLMDFGFGLGDIKCGSKILIIAIPLLVVPLVFIGSKMPDIRAEYPLSKLIFTRHDLILWHELTYFLFYYLAWEFFFRGFLLFGLRKPFGGMNAILIQTISSCLIHLGKPEGEIIGSIFIGVLFGTIALKTRSFWYVFILHASIGILTDLFIIFF